MAKKAVYNNQYLAIYITKDDFDEMVRLSYIQVPVYIGQNGKDVGMCKVRLNFLAQSSIAFATRAERGAIKETRDKFKKIHPNYKTYAERKGRKQNG